MKAVVILSKLTNGTGNKTTAERICFYLKEEFTIHLLDTSTFEKADELYNFIKKHEIQAVLGIHLVHAGKLLIECPVPYAVIFGGTDLNVAKNGAEIALMDKATMNSKYLISFNDVMKSMAKERWTNCWELEKILVLHQGVIIETTSFGYEDLFAEFGMDQLVSNFKDKLVFIMVGGIRPVKDVLYVVDVIKDWHSKDNRVCLVVVGPELDVEYAKRCKSAFSNSDYLFMFPTLEKPRVNALMQRSFALLNSSVSEGMASAILEAMYLGVPVIARRNEGNAALVCHMANGVLYDSPKDFEEKASMLTVRPDVRQELVTNAYRYVKESHDWKTERHGYLTLMRQMVS